MKLLILGAAGESGRRLVQEAVSRGHDVTAFVRRRDRLLSVLTASAGEGVHILEGDALDRSALCAAMSGAEAVLNAAGNARRTPAYADLVISVISAAEEALGEGGRIWVFGGAAALNVPGSSLTGNDLPGSPPAFRAHREVHHRLLRSCLDWSMLCPGPMIPQTEGMRPRRLVLSTEEWPLPLLLPARSAPRALLSAAFLARVPAMTVTYEEAARVILDELGRNGPFRCKRVGLARA